jgi:hypothetical protein
MYYNSFTLNIPKQEYIRALQQSSLLHNGHEEQRYALNTRQQARTILAFYLRQAAITADECLTKAEAEDQGTNCR